MNIQTIWSGAIVLTLILLPEMSNARWLDANNGRFHTMDSFEGNQQEPATLHLYVYCNADPVNGKDPTGLWREIASDFRFGKEAEQPVVRDFLSQRPAAGEALLSIHGILDYASKTGYKDYGRLIPDLVDPEHFEIYDVKSWNQTPLGMMKVQAYAIAFEQADPDRGRGVKWHAGTTYNYLGANPVKLPGKSNGKDVWAMYYPTEAAVIPYKLYETDDDQDMRRIPVPSPVRIRVRRPETEYWWVHAQPMGTLVYADYRVRSAANSVALTTGAALALYVGYATLNAMAGAP